MITGQCRSVYARVNLATAAAPTSARERTSELLLCALLLVGLPIALASAPKIFNDGDVSWHIVTGRWILDHRQIPVADPFSFTALGHPWVATEWLADVALASAFNAASYSGLAALAAAALAGLHWIVFARARRSF